MKIPVLRINNEQVIEWILTNEHSKKADYNERTLKDRVTKYPAKATHYSPLKKNEQILGTGKSILIFLGVL